MTSNPHKLCAGGRRGECIDCANRELGILRMRIHDLFEGHLHTITVNLNDTFAYATADAEDIETGEELGKFYAIHGWYGFVAIATKKRMRFPVKEVRINPAFQAAITDLNQNLALLQELYTK